MILRRYERVQRPLFPDHRASALRSVFSGGVRVVDVIWLESAGETESQMSALDDAMEKILLDPVLHEPTLRPQLTGPGLERRFIAGTTDNRARTLLEALTLKLPDLDLEKTRIRTGELLVFEGLSEFPLSDSDLDQALKPNWMNPFVHETSRYTAAEVENEEAHSPSRFEGREIARHFQALRATESESSREKVETIPITGMDADELLALSESRLLALNEAELKTIQKHFRERGRDCTDVELEIIAQTWSEHCQHKIFAAKIDYHSVDAEDPATEIPREVNGVFKETIRKTTEELRKPWLLSVFSDNAGIVRFTTDDAICLKVETHNSPSALDPFGGAITGIVGVNRDILGCGLGAKPIANLDVFCVAPPETPNSMPEKILPPERILEGIRAGVEAGGNQSGIPTVNGSVNFHASYLGKPLVFCGTLGWMPTVIQGRECSVKEIRPGDLVVMLGGRIGRDGIHGATFSSLALTESVPGSVVQLGDPITQKRMTDFLLEARDRNLYRAITDNGAGGLSSSIGEMARLSGGARIDVSRAPTKVPGLLPFELVISESQERMSLAVDPAKMDAFLRLARSRGVEASVLGEFNESGAFQVDYRGSRVADLDLHFLHEQTPRLHLQARWAPQPRPFTAPPAREYESLAELAEDWKRVLAHPNVASKEAIIRQYDHEVQGRSVLKPLTTLTHSSPSDAAVIALRPSSPEAVVLGHGLAPLLSEADPYFMAQMAVDEAIRNVLCTGAEYSATDPSKLLALTDNFCWPDPTESPELAAALVRTAYGMRKACLEFRAPLISGKDSMKNDFKGEKDGKKIRISVLPTLLMTALGRMADLAATRSSEFKAPGDWVYLLGPGHVSLEGSIHGEVHGKREDVLPIPHYPIARALYEFLGSADSRPLRSAHDCSEGGLFAALAESCFARDLGLRFHRPTPNTDRACFGEGFHRVVVSCRAEDAPVLQRLWIRCGIPFEHLGEVTEYPVIEWPAASGGEQRLDLGDLREAWGGPKGRKGDRP